MFHNFVKDKTMSNDTIDIASKELWERAKTIYLSTLFNEQEKSQADNYFSMITSVSVEGNVFLVRATNKFAAYIFIPSKLSIWVLFIGSIDSIESISSPQKLTRTIKSESDK